MNYTRYRKNKSNKTVFSHASGSKKIREFDREKDPKTNKEEKTALDSKHSQPI